MNIRFFVILMLGIGAACFSNNTQAQIRVRFNIGVQPVWGPVGYDYAEYYYIPDIDAYYDVNNQYYVYYDNGSWVTMRELPPRYRNFDLYRAHKVVINESTPWMHNDRYQKQYYRYRGHHDQQPIRNSRDQKYWENPNHPQHNNWHAYGENRGGYGHDDRGRGQDKGHQPEQRNDNRGPGQDRGRQQEQRQDNRGPGQDRGRQQEQHQDNRGPGQDRGRQQEQRQDNRGHGKDKGRQQDQRKDDHGDNRGK